MKVRIKAFGILHDYTEGLGEHVETEGPDLKGLFKQLSITADLVMLATVNGDKASFDRPIMEGDNVMLVPPVTGG